MANNAYARLNNLMQARRLELGMKTWRALADKAQIAYETLRAMRAGQNVAPGTIHAVEKALRWTPGSIETILAGGKPRIVADEGAARLEVTSAMTAQGTVELPALDDLPDDPVELARIAQRFLADSREHRRISEELYRQAEEILRRITETDESANPSAS